MKQTVLILVAALSAAGIGTGAAMARGQSIDFETLDSDGNGELTREELIAHAQARFDRIDTNGDGQVTQAELEADVQARSADRAARAIARMDSDGDGQLTAVELMGRRDPARIFDRMDRDDSGTVTQAEFDRMRERAGGRHGKGEQRRGE